ncbi:MAG: bifunctional hydroxymethylpyrimidine kinase/phosphomethylpyrimidine kinase [Thermoleophilia bacterium]|nr:bifunctional hydroxymethylpyrimidine kinase/phosphomethylpyrimidine kinase [Thermoleophilia bacterium]
MGPVVVVGAHVQGLFLHVAAVPREGESVIGWGFEEPFDGGKSSNQAVAAARLGAPTVFVSVVGSDERGRRAVEFFRGQGIETRFCFQVEGPTDVGFVLLPPSKIPAIASALERNRELDVSTVERAAEAIRAAAVVVCALEAPQETARAAFALARAAGAPTVLNPAPADELDPDLVALTDVLVPNEHEAARLAGREGAPGELAVELAERLPGTAVVVTAGAAGAYTAESGRVRHVEARAVEAVDTTGAGDAFVAALAVRLRAGDAVTAATAFAVRAATISVTRPGTMTAFASAQEMEPFAYA